MKDITFVIPMYNVEQYLEKCLNSISSQNLADNTFEVIMVDDESPDNSLEKAKKLASQYPYIKIISQKNKGLGGARNTGIRHAVGKFILFLDADDWLLPSTISKLLQLANKNNLEILEFGANIVSENNEIINSLSMSSHGEIYTGITYYSKIKYGGSACNKLYSIEFLKENKLFFLDKIYGEDFEFNTRAFFYAKRMQAVNNICTAFLQSSNSITRNNSATMKNKYLNDFHVILSSIKSFQALQSKATDPLTEAFFNERLTLVNINAFYMMFKNKYSYKRIDDYKSKLKKDNLFSVNYPVSHKQKNLFRKIFLKHFLLFRATQTFRNLIKK
ncbi:glycosyltransferase family 2 protein [Tamlana sp. 2_MG-2023]|uniref:glycosyltransferase family 2 protein n=1 Tax=unclassified Tamlana TaxID=2614803 RepID=UPI0026E2D399|nr:MULTISPECIES: glycosyltransferase family 2 protein [unclassified Tamlana]MDO6759414.1 glycosyltransferase family 2 protein [Tamlana sp. 2_MG-2023]MDO6790447.1 glycosyltransferase family 2 protein [Tamlana sp. 1_MG-2023]